MRTRSVARASLAASAAVLLTVSAVLAIPAVSFTPPERLGFPNGDDWEPSIAADDAGFVYALWNHYVGFGGADTGDPDPSCLQCPSPHMVIQIYDPIDGWGNPHALAPSEQRQDDPQIVVDPVTQYVYAAYMEGNKSSIVVARSTNQGQTFVPVVVEEIERGLDKIALAARDGDVYVVYHSKQKIFASFSHDDGATWEERTWETVQPIHNTNSAFGESLPSGAAIDSDGTAYFAWNGANNPGQAKGTINLFVTSTDDGGQTWTTSVVDQSQAPPQCACGGWAYWGSQMAIGVDGEDRVYVMWNANEVKYGPHRMYFAVSIDGAASWSDPVDVSPLAPAGVNHVFPALVAGGARDVRIAWTDDRNGSDAGGNDPDARWNTYYRQSTDAGATWSDETQLSAFVSGFTYKSDTPADGYLQPYGDYFELDLDSAGKTVAFWGEGNSYVGPGNVWFARQQ